MLLDEAKKQKEYEFNQLQKKINDLISECENLYNFLLKYNDLITYEELYTLSEEEKDEFIKIRDRAHEMEHLLLHYREDLIGLVEGDVEWFLTDDEPLDERTFFKEYYSSDIFFKCFRIEISLSLLFDKLKQLNVPRRIDPHFQLHVHNSGGCC